MAGHDAETFCRYIRDAVEHDKRRTQAAVSDRRRVRDQAQHSSKEWIEAEADHDGAADGHRRAPTGRPFEEGAERKADQNRLNACVTAESRYRSPHDAEISRLHGDVVKEHGIE